MGAGGARSGAGRKPKNDEDRVRTLALSSIVKTFGSEEKGFAYLLNSNEPSLMKFVFEHAFGKPKDKVEHSGDMGITWKEVKNYGANDKADKGS